MSSGGVCCLLVSALIDVAWGHAYVFEPPSRNIMSHRRDLERCPHCLQANGPHAVKDRGNGIWPTIKDPSSHGLCGDPVQLSAEPLGISDMKFMEADSPQRTYVAGSTVEFKVGVATHHWGHYEFRICDRVLDQDLESAEAGQQCLNKWVLKRAPRKQSCGNSFFGDCQRENPKHPERWYLPPPQSNTGLGTAEDPKDLWHANEVHTMTFVIPEDLVCTHCTLQFYYATGNTCVYDEDYFGFDPGFQFWLNQYESWARCENSCCRSESGPFGEEFWNCADVSVVSNTAATTSTVSNTLAATITTTASPSTTTPGSSHCSKTQQDCRSTQCCDDASLTCFAKNDWWAECKPSCTPGIDYSEPPEYQTEWSCAVLSLQITTTTSTPAVLCSVSKQDCRSSMCCKDHASTCFEKNAWWAECKSSCTPGIDPNDAPEYQSPWSCAVLSSEVTTTTTTALKCSGIKEDCRSSMCCKDQGWTCYEKNAWWAECKASCTPGIDSNDAPEYQSPWTCAVLASPDASKTTTTFSTCADMKQDCRSSSCCNDDALLCYEKNPWWAECRPSCTPGIDSNDAPEYQTPWSCTVLSSGQTTTTTTLSLSCSGLKQDCRSSKCCADPASQCYEKNEWWAECLTACTPGIDANEPEQYRTPWSCRLLEADGQCQNLKSVERVCSTNGCKVLATGMTDRTCQQYCAEQGLSCKAAWEEDNDDCIEKETLTCDQTWPGTSDLICECEPMRRLMASGTHIRDQGIEEKTSAGGLYGLGSGIVIGTSFLALVVCQTLRRTAVPNSACKVLPCADHDEDHDGSLQ